MTNIVEEIDNQIEALQQARKILSDISPNLVSSAVKRRPGRPKLTNTIPVIKRPYTKSVKPAAKKSVLQTPVAKPLLKLAPKPVVKKSSKTAVKRVVGRSAVKKAPEKKIEEATKETAK